MKVKEFIDLLYTCDFDAEVCVCEDDNYFPVRKLTKEVRSEISLNDVSQVVETSRVILI